MRNITKRTEPTSLARLSHNRNYLNRPAHPDRNLRSVGYAVARCCSRPPRRTLMILDTPGSCMVTP